MTANTKHQFLSVPLLAFRLRALVLALGECVQPPWWKTEFMTETGLRFLERLYPRTYFRAAVHAAGRAACDVHDRSVGRIGVYHLFRLPESVEVDMSRIVPSTDQQFITSVRNALGNPDKLEEFLSPLCGGTGTDSAPGPKRVGTYKELIVAAGFKKAATAYRQAFSDGKPAFPYFTEEQGEGSE